jgi:hypothetical protein
MASKWEYQIIEAISLSTSLCNGLGSSGWELISVTYKSAGLGSFTMVFKRELVTAPPSQSVSSIANPVQTTPIRGG